MKEKKPRVGDLVRIDKEYPNTEAAGQLAMIVRTLGIECVVQPIGPRLSAFMQRHEGPWWFARTYLEVISESR
jgi:hypothetical protein